MFLSSGHIIPFFYWVKKKRLLVFLPLSSHHLDLARTTESLIWTHKSIFQSRIKDQYQIELKLLFSWLSMLYIGRSKTRNRQRIWHLGKLLFNFYTFTNKPLRHTSENQVTTWIEDNQMWAALFSEDISIHAPQFYQHGSVKLTPEKNEV